MVLKSFVVLGVDIGEQLQNKAKYFRSFGFEDDVEVSES